LIRVKQLHKLKPQSSVVAFITFVNDGEIHENFLCCKELPETSKGQDIFNVLSSYMETKGLSWKNCVGICTDGGISVVGSIISYASLAKKKKKKKKKSQHCFIHREVQVSKLMEMK
jgi:hypothetical protein